MCDIEFYDAESCAPDSARAEGGFVLGCDPGRRFVSDGAASGLINTDD